MDTLSNPTTWSIMDILTSPEAFTIGCILGTFYIFNEVFPMIGDTAMIILAMASGALVFMLHNNIL